MSQIVFFLNYIIVRNILIYVIFEVMRTHTFANAKRAWSIEPLELWLLQSKMIYDTIVSYPEFESRSSGCKS